MTTVLQGHHTDICLVPDTDPSSFALMVKELLACSKVGTADVTRIDADTNLFDNGYLTSLSFLHFVLSLEKRLQLKISLSQYPPGAFSSIAQMYQALVAFRTDESGAQCR